ncbi:hypothetical protein ACF0H5_009740 [Mactra antiquata]
MALNWKNVLQGRTTLCHVLEAHQCMIYRSVDVCQDPVHIGTTLHDDIYTASTCRSKRRLLKETGIITRQYIKTLNIRMNDFKHEHDITTMTSFDVNMASIFETSIHSNISLEGLSTLSRTFNMTITFIFLDMREREREGGRERGGEGEREEEEEGRERERDRGRQREKERERKGR